MKKLAALIGVMLLVASGLACCSKAESFAGEYDTTWGVAKLTQSGNKVDCTYAKGTMSCTAEGKTLACDWKESETSGKAVFKKEADGRLVGTWGNGTSTTDGGEWVFTPKK